MSKILIAYFSTTGKTKKLADTLAKASDGDLFEIKPVQKYSTSDVNWNASHSRANQEMKDHEARPAIDGKVEGMEAYDTVFVGFPIWYIAPRIIQTFLESYDFANKNLIVFAASGDNDIEMIVEHLKPCCPESTKWLGGKNLRSFTDEETLEDWIESLGINIEENAQKDDDVIL